MTGEIYELRTVADFVRVPDDRLKLCLEEFGKWLALVKGTDELNVKLGELMNHDGPLIKVGRNVFKWIDDDEGAVHLKITGLPKDQSA